jgi:hypothetical protein
MFAGGSSCGPLKDGEGEAGAGVSGLTEGVGDVGFGCEEPTVADGAVGVDMMRAPGGSRCGPLKDGAGEVRAGVRMRVPVAGSKLVGRTARVAAPGSELVGLTKPLCAGLGVVDCVPVTGILEIGGRTGRPGPAPFMPMPPPGAAYASPLVSTSTSAPANTGIFTWFMTRLLDKRSPRTLEACLQKIKRARERGGSGSSLARIRTSFPQPLAARPQLRLNSCVGAAMEAVYRKRENLFVNGETEWRVADDALIRVTPDGKETRVPWRDVTSLRLRFYPTSAKPWLHEFHLATASAAIVIDNCHFAGVGDFQDRSADYSAFVRAALAHIRACAPGATVALGSNPATFWTMMAFVAASMALLAAVLILIPLPAPLPVVVIAKLAVFVIALVRLPRWIARNWPREGDLETAAAALPLSDRSPAAD